MSESSPSPDVSTVTSIAKELRPNIIWDGIKFVASGVFSTAVFSAFLHLVTTISLNVVVIIGLFVISLLLFGSGYFFQYRKKNVEQNSEKLNHTVNVEGSLEETTKLKKKRRTALLTYTSIVFVLLILLATAFTLGTATNLNSSTSSSVEGNYQPREIIRNKKFTNEKVLLDGYKYENCTFTNVTFVYNATTPAQLTHNTFVGSIRVTTENSAVDRTAFLLKGLGFLKKDIPIRDSNDNPLITLTEINEEQNKQNK